MLSPVHARSDALSFKGYCHCPSVLIHPLSGSNRPMRLSLSTNWCNRRMESGEEIADKAMELGFQELELGYHTTLFQVKGFKARLDQIPVGSIHAFCPVPISAPQGYPELYSLASFDEESRKMAKLMIGRNVKFAAEMGAD